MAVLNPEHFFDQAMRLTDSLSAGPPRQVDLRRAVSATYYGLFHFVLAAAADEFIGTVNRTKSDYALAYRSIDHKTLRDLYIEVLKPTPGKKYSPFVPVSGFGKNLPVFARTFRDLYEKRHSADYDPMIRLKQSDARLAVETARSAIRLFGRVSPARRKTFLTLLVFGPR